MSATVDFKAERLNRGLSVEAMADEVGVLAHVWRHVESGGRPQPRNALTIASFFHLKVTEVWPLAAVPSNGEAA